MSEAYLIDPRTPAIDVPVATYEKMILEATIASVVDDTELAMNSLLWAYERALRDRYPYKDVR